ncbi:hypothetical protein ACOBQJ_01405 [Pelotomaculum propionicicum]|uniref:hypothetical protein n=1 Tax=Pelotomaculum propionicicum TaxID=258475 RepID=UPI003B77FC4E
MQWKGLKLHVIIFSLLIGIALIFGAQWMYQKYNINGPINKVLSANQAVKSYQVSSEGGTLLVSVHINSEADLMVPYQEIRKDLEQVMGGKSFIFILSDDRDGTLEQVWYRCQYAVYQAQVQGSFVEMAEVINREALAGGSEANINIDQEYIYLRLRHQNHTLDEVIPRGAYHVAGNNWPAAGGGVNDQRN